MSWQGYRLYSLKNIVTNGHGMDGQLLEFCLQRLQVLVSAATFALQSQGSRPSLYQARYAADDNKRITGLTSEVARYFRLTVFDH